MLQYFTGKRALITGGASGIGAAAAMLYSVQGAKVIVSDINEDSGYDTVAKIKSNNGEATFIRADVRSPAECKQLILRAAETYGSIDIAFNNSTTLDESLSPDDKNLFVFDHAVEANLHGLFYCMKYEIEAMQKKDGGVIVNMTSIVSPLDFGSYNPHPDAKYGVAELGQNAPKECSDKKISINEVTPAFTRTAIIKDSNAKEKDSPVRLSPMGRLVKTEKVADLIIWLSSDEAPFGKDL
jgi:NAD(P)-dependent dehydrogenase (short-subunit alcohol dehydrogenase family)